MMGILPQSQPIAGYIPALIPVNGAGQPVALMASPPAQAGYFGAMGGMGGPDMFMGASPFGAPPPMMGMSAAGSGSQASAAMFMMAAIMLVMAMAGGNNGQNAMGGFPPGMGGGFTPPDGDFGPPPAWGGGFPSMGGSPAFPGSWGGDAGGSSGGIQDLIGAFLPLLFRGGGSPQARPASRMPWLDQGGDNESVVRRPRRGEWVVASKETQKSSYFGKDPQSLSGSKQRAIVKTANRLGIDPVDLAAVISKETGGTFNPRIIGGANNKYQGLIQFGPSEREKYGYNANHSFEQQVEGPVYRYLKDRGVRPGMGAKHIYAAILTGNANGNIYRRDAFGTSVSNALPGLMNGGHRRNALQFLAQA